MYGTLWYRAVEVLLGDTAWGLPMDIWATACVLSEMIRFEPLFVDKTQLGMIVAVLRLLGSPVGSDAAYARSLPFWSNQFPFFAKPTMDSVMSLSLDLDDLALFKQMLRINPDERVRATSALKHFTVSAERRSVPSPAAPSEQDTRRSVSPEPLAAATSAFASARASALKSLALNIPGGGNTLAVARPMAALLTLVSDKGANRFVGARGEFNLLHGQMPTDVLDWMREGDFFQAGMGLSFLTEGPEAGLKAVVNGHLGGDFRRKGLTLNGQAAVEPQWARFRAWAKAFRNKNADAFFVTQAEIRKRVGTLDETTQGMNGRALMEECISSWVADLGSTQLMAPSSRQDPTHFDGGASFFHIGLTLYGKRDIHFLLEEGRELVLPTRPGMIYCGCLCCAEHFVRHSADGGGLEDLLEHPELGRVEVVLLARSRIFRKTMASTAKAGPNPKAVFQAALEPLVGCMESLVWQLPSIGDCLAAELEDI